MRAKASLMFALPGPDGFNLATLQLDARFIAVEDVIIAKRLAIDDRLGSHISRAGAPASRLRRRLLNH